MTDQAPHSASRPRPDTVSLATRGVAILALFAAVIVVALIVFENGSSYSLHADFRDASGLVTGDLVFIGPNKVGTVDSIGLTPSGSADVKLSLNSDVGRLHQGTIARIYEDSLSGIASKYVSLEPGPQSAPAIQNGGVIEQSHTTSMVNLDELFDTLDPLTRIGLRRLIRGEAASCRQGSARQQDARIPRARVRALAR